MNVTKCTNGHFFDADKYQVCPHCGSAPIVNEQNISAADEKKLRMPFWGKKRTTVSATNVVEMPDKTIGKTFGVFDKPGDKNITEIATDAFVAEVVVVCPVCHQTYNGINATCPHCSKITAEDKAKDEVCEKHRASSYGQHYDSQPPYTVVESSSNTVGVTGEKSESLSEAIKKAVSGNEGKTVGFFSSATTDSNVISNEPIVGWLVCIKGKHFGEVFSISAGRNSIGRGESNKINIMRDDAVSRNKHAWLTYEPKKRDFYIQPGEGSCLSYLNDETIMEPKKLKAKDVLEFGNGQYMLIPLCGEDFSWEDYLDKE